MTPDPLPPAAVALLACPVCGGVLVADDRAGLGCGAGHRFDRARQGHVTLLPPGHRAPTGDSAQMVADRADFLAAGHYGELTTALADAVLADGIPGSVLDVGGGTGHHLAGVLNRAPGAVGVVLDSSPYAARRAARSHPRAMAVVTDSWTRWPIGEGVADRVIVVFAPRNGAETARVLRPDGRLIVVTPTEEHLGELVGPLGLLRVDPDKTARLAASLDPHLQRIGSTEHRRELHLDRSAVAALVGMGPHARHLERSRLEAVLGLMPEPVTVTVAVVLSVYRPRPVDRIRSRPGDDGPGARRGRSTRTGHRRRTV